MRSIFLFSHAPSASPIRDALAYGTCHIDVYELADGHFACPITAPPQLAILEPRRGAPIAPLLTALGRHPVVGRVNSLIVLDQRWLPLAPRLRCTDFITRDAPPAEVIARVARLVGEDRDERQPPIDFGLLFIDFEGVEVRVAGKQLHLTPQEFALLSHLVRHPGRAWDRQTLLNRVWGHNYMGGTRTVDIHVRRLRMKLRAPLATHLQTVRGIGYKWSLAPPPSEPSLT